LKRKTTLLVALLLIITLLFSSCSSSDDEDIEFTDPVITDETENSDVPSQASADDVTLIGDSVVLGAVDAVKAAIPGIDILARTDRELSGPGLDLLKQEAADGQLRDIVVLALGTNNLSEDDLNKALGVIGTDHQVVFVNAYRRGASYVETVNETIDKVAAANESHFTVADWYGYVTSHKDIKLAADGCHLTPTSAEDYADVIKAGVDEARAK